MARKKQARDLEILPPDSKAARYPDKEDPENEARLIKFNEKKGFHTLAEKIAESTIYIRNYKFPMADQRIPPQVNPDFKFVDKFFPYAKGGPLYVDEPRDDKDTQLSFEKQRILIHLGMRHLVVEDSSTLIDVITQIERVDNELEQRRKRSTQSSK